MKRRRLQVFMSLVIAAVVSFFLAVLFRGVFVWQHLLIDALLIGYTIMAARAGANEQMRRQKVTYLGSGVSGSRIDGYARAVGER